MSKRLLFFSVSIICFNFFGQENTSNDSLPIFNEVNISINRTFVSDTNTTDHFGFGIGIYHTFRSSKKLNIRTGIEFNRTTQFKKLIFEGENIYFSGANVFEKTFVNTTYHLNCLSIPLVARYNFGKKQNVFIEGGVFADIMFNAQRDAYLYGVEYKDSAFVVKNEEIQESVNLVNTFGATIGFGFKIPFEKYEFTIRPEFKYAFRKVYDSSIQITDMYNHYAKISFGFKW